MGAGLSSESFFSSHHAASPIVSISAFWLPSHHRYECFARSREELWLQVLDVLHGDLELDPGGEFLLSIDGLYHASPAEDLLESSIIFCSYDIFDARHQSRLISIVRHSESSIESICLMWSSMESEANETSDDKSSQYWSNNSDDSFFVEDHDMKGKCKNNVEECIFLP